MKWRRPPEELVELFHSVIPNGPADFRPMFGSPCYWVNGNMFTAVHQESIIVRLPQNERDELLAQPGASHFEPMEGRPMREYVVLPPRVLEDREALQGWIGKGMAYAASLPPKQKKARKPRA